MATKRTYITHPIKPTALGQKVLRVRLSMRKTQAEFAEHFRVSALTVHRWEVGRVAKMQRIHSEILDRIYDQLNSQGSLIPKEVFATFYREAIAQRGTTEHNGD